MPSRLTRISSVQQGIIAQNEFAKLLMMGSNGLIEVAAPLSDDERRDFEIHIHGIYGSALAVQVKSVLQLARRLRTQAHYLHTNFAVRASRLVSHPLFWYFFAYLDPDRMVFADPTFLVPSSEIHEHANPEKKGDRWLFNFEAGMEARTHDRWIPYRVNTLDLGQKVLAIMRDQASVTKRMRVGQGLTGLPDLPDVVLIQKR